MNPIAPGPFRILIADDDADDVQITRECFVETKFDVEVVDVPDGEKLLNRLKEQLINSTLHTLPQLILLDLNMPRVSGFEALKELKENEQLRKIPVVVFSTSATKKDIEIAYELGANCYVTKSSNIDEWCDKMTKLSRFWIECASLA